jgi:phenylalanyl-tRNA synthetase beta chain
LAVKRLTSLNVNSTECERILNALGIRKERETVYVSPTWRHDIQIEEDLVEEVARHTGYDKIAELLPPAYGAGEYQPNEWREKLLRQKLVDMGFDEAVSYSFIDTKFDDVFDLVPNLTDSNSSEQYVTLQDAVIEGAVRMRPTNIPGLLEAVRLNFNYQRRDLKLFEIGKVFAANTGEDKLPTEQKALTFVLTGSEFSEDRMMPLRELDFYDAKGAVESALESIGIRDAQYSAVSVKHLQPGQSAQISISDMHVGYVGRLNQGIASMYKFRQPVYIAELNLDAVLALPPSSINYRPLPKFPAVVRDLSFVGDRKITFEEIRKAIEVQNVELCQNVQFVDVYDGKSLEEGDRSVTIRLEYRSNERTLVEEEVDETHKRIIDAVRSNLGVKLRT